MNIVNMFSLLRQTENFTIKTAIIALKMAPENGAIRCHAIGWLLDPLGGCWIQSLESTLSIILESNECLLDKFPALNSCWCRVARVAELLDEEEVPGRVARRMKSCWCRVARRRGSPRQRRCNADATGL